MTYNLEWLLAGIESGRPFKYLYFWGHQPSRDGRITKSCLSQWWEQPFEVEHIIYPSAEHWMMAEKARLFNDEDTLERILQVQSPAEAKKLGREVRDFDLSIWKEHCFDIVRTGNVHKFSQNPDLQDFLLNTSDRILVEASPYDQVWGIGMKEGDAGIEYPENWRGQNLLGFALMEVRDELKTGK